MTTRRLAKLRPATRLLVRAKRRRSTDCSLLHLTEML
jgi:hypothetical protein